MPAIEAYRGDSGTYAGMTVAGLQSQYSPGVQGIAVVSTDANATACVRPRAAGPGSSSAPTDRSRRRPARSHFRRVTASAAQRQSAAVGVVRAPARAPFRALCPRYRTTRASSARRRRRSPRTSLSSRPSPRCRLPLVPASALSRRLSETRGRPRRGDCAPRRRRGRGPRGASILAAAPSRYACLVARHPPPAVEERSGLRVLSRLELVRSDPGLVTVEPEPGRNVGRAEARTPSDRAPRRR